MALRHKDHNSTDELKQKNDTILKHVPMFGCRTFFEERSVVMNNKIHIIYQLLRFKSMRVSDVRISRELEIVFFADWAVNVYC